MSRTFNRKLSVDKLKPGMKVEFPKVYAVVKQIQKATSQGATISDNVYLLELVGDCGPFKGKKPRIIVGGSEKLDVVFRHRWFVRLAMWIAEKAATARKPMLAALSSPK